MGRTLSTITSRPQWRKQRSTCWSKRAIRCTSRRTSLCCGRPLYDYGMLDTAKALLRQILDTLREPIRNGVPIVGLEPSCMTVFREELINLLYGDEDAKRLGEPELHPERVPARQVRITGHPLCAARRWSTAIAITSPTCTSNPRWTC